MSSAPSMVAALGPRQSDDQVPLTFTQQAHWNSYVAGERPTVREVAAATLLYGPVDLDALRRGVSQVVHRHEALRTRIALHEGTPLQKVHEPDVGPHLLTDDLIGAAPRTRMTSLQQLIAQATSQPIDLEREVPFQVRAARVGPDEHVLIVSMNHLICDGYSLGIVLTDLFHAYELETRGTGEPWREIRVQFPDYGIWQRRTHSAWLAKHSTYWTARLAGCQRLRFPQDTCLPGAGGEGWGCVCFTIGRQLQAQVQASARAHRTTLVMMVFAIYVGFVLRWCEASEAIFRFQTNGRTSVALQHTVGFFASVLSLRIELQPRDSFVDLLQRVTAEYCSACAHADAGYLESRWPLPPFARNCIFNWIPFAKSDYRTPASISASPIRFVNPVLAKLRLDNEPIMTLRETAETIEGEVAFPLDRFSTRSMERFSHRFQAFLLAASRDVAARMPSIHGD